jgi:hypothetical protein
MNLKTVFAAAAAASLAASPAAAADLHDAQQAGFRSSGFAGATLRIGLDRHRPEAARPRLAIGVSRVHERLDAAGRVERLTAPGLELALGRGGRPLLLVGGETSSEARRRLGINGTHAALAVVGLAAAGFAIVELTGDDTDDMPLDEKQCLIPEGCPTN